MSDPFHSLAETHRGAGPRATVDSLVELLRAQRDYFHLFDALLLRKKFELGVPVGQPTSLDDVPEEHRDAFEEAYIDAAREVGRLLLESGDIPRAWPYFRTIRETQPVRDAIEALDLPHEANEETEQVTAIAVYEGANPGKGIEMLLRTHGTCNTITAVDQQLYRMPPADQQRVVGLLVRHLHEDLLDSVRRDVERRIALLPPTDSLVELIAGRDWLFQEGNYHIDASHLHSVVRFARTLEPGNPALPAAVDLAEYGARLDPQLQYPGDPPFEEFYPAHALFLSALAGRKRPEAYAYFREKLAEEPDEPDRQLIAFVLVDLLTRCGERDQAFEVAAEHLRNVDESTGFSFARLCRESGRTDALRQYAQDTGDLVGYVTALLS